METKESQSRQQQPSTAECGQAGCLCGGAGPGFSRLLGRALREMGPPEDARRHFAQARLEALKGLRALIDQRIDGLQKRPTGGVKVTVD